MTIKDLVAKYGADELPSLTFAVLQLVAARAGLSAKDIDDAVDLVHNQGNFDLPLPASGGGGSVTGVNGSQHKALVNNTNNDLFTFPLADGSHLGIILEFTVAAKEGADYAFASAILPAVFYNNGGVLEVSASGNSPDMSAGSVISEDKQSNTVNVTINHFQTLIGTLNSGVVTASFNPGNVGTAPDSIDLDYVAIVPQGITLTYL